MSFRIPRVIPLLPGLILACWPAVTPTQDASFEKVMRDAMKAQQQGCDAEAARLYLSAIQEAEKLGPENPRLAIALNNLGMLYEHQGQSAKAEELLNRALAIDEKVLGPEHPRVANGLITRALRYERSGREAEAEKLLKRALEIHEKAPAKEYPPLLGALTNLAVLYLRQKRYAEAESLYARALDVCESSTRTAVPCSSFRRALASVYRDEGREAEAERLLEDAAAATEANAGVKRQDLRDLDNLINLAEHYREQGAYTEAESAFNRARAFVEQLKSPDAQPGLLWVLKRQADLYRAWGRSSEAEDLLKRAFELELGLVPGHPQTATSLEFAQLVLVGFYREQGRLADVEPYLTRALSIQEQALGPEHGSVAQTRMILAEVYRDEGKYEDGEPLFKRVLEIQEKKLGPNSIRLAAVLDSYARLLEMAKREDEAAAMTAHANAIREKLKTQNSK